MKIDNTNKEIIIDREVHIHDLIFKDIGFNYSDKSLIIHLLKCNSEDSFNIICHNVYGFEMLSGDFWGKSLRVFDWEVCEADEKNITKEVNQKRLEYLYNTTQDFLLIDNLEFRIILVSGDSLKICCQYITLEGYE